MKPCSGHSIESLLNLGLILAQHFRAVQYVKGKTSYVRHYENSIYDVKIKFENSEVY